MAFSKITLNNDTLMDVTQDTVASSNLLSGETATGADGETVEGAIEIKQTGPTVVPTFNTSTGNIHIEATTESGYYDSNKTTTGNYTPAAIGIPTQGSKTVTPSESAQSAVTAGKYTTGEVTVGAISSTYVGSGITQRNADDMTVSGASVTAPAGYYAEASSKAIAAATQATPSVEINSSTGLVTATSAQAAGYVSGGTKTGTLQLSAQGAKTVTPSESSQTAVAAGKYTTGAVTVGAVSSTYVGSGIAKRSATDITADGAVVSVPAGYYASNGSKSVASGSAATPATSITANPTISVDSSGLITASVSGSKSVTPTVSAGYVSSGTAGTVSVSGSATEQLLFEAKTVAPSNVATVVTPGTASSLLATILPSSWTHPTNKSMKNTSYDFSDFIDGKTYRITGYVSTYDGGGYIIGDSSLEIDETFDYAPSGENYSYRIEIPWENNNQYKYYMDIYKNTGTLSITNNYSYSSDGVFAEDDNYVSCNFYIYKVIPYNGLSSVTVNPIPSEYVVPTGTITLNQNGTTNVSGYASADVDVQPNVWRDSEGYLCLDIPVEDAVVFVDYDGTVLHSYTSYEFRDLDGMPDNPSHTGLVAQGWNWTRDQILTQMRNAPEQSIYVGQMYITQSGNTEIDVTFDDPEFLSPYLAIGVAGTVVVDWGDGSSTDTMSGSSLSTLVYQQHTYAQTGSYTISINVTSGSFSFTGSTSNFPGVLRAVNTTEGKARNRVYACAIKAIRIGSNVTGIRNYAFNYCYSLSSITIPSGVTSIANYTFSGCYSLASITIPSGVTSIESSAFYNCYSFTSIAIPSGVTSIGSSAFYDCYSLTSITIPSGVTSIGSGAFQGCCSLVSVAIPLGVTSIEGSVFNNCYSLTSITIPSEVTSIGSSAFSYCFSLTSITIPSGVTSIASNAFYNCYSLTSIAIPSGVTSIGNNAFYDCYSLTSITIPSGVTSIGSGMFSYCYSLTSITIPSGVTSIGNNAFGSCYSLRSITIPSGVTSIVSNAFNSCFSITEYHLLPTTPPTLADTTVFSNMASDCIIYVPVGTLSTYQGATNWSTYASKMREEGT